MRDKNENWQYPYCQYHDLKLSSDEIEIKMRGVTESPLFSGFWRNLRYQLAPWNAIPQLIYKILYNTNEWKLDPNNPATWTGSWKNSQYTIVEYSNTDYIGAYICQPALFGMKFEDVIVMTPSYSDKDASFMLTPVFVAFKTSFQAKLDAVGYDFTKETKETVTGCCWSSCY